MLKWSILIVVAALALHASPALARPRHQRQVIELPNEPNVLFDYSASLPDDEYKTVAKTVKSALRDNPSASDLAKIATYYFWRNAATIPQEHRIQGLSLYDYYHSLHALLISDPSKINAFSSSIIDLIDEKLHKIAEEEERTRKLTREKSENEKVIGDYLRKNPELFKDLQDITRNTGFHFSDSDDLAKLLS